MQHEEQKALVKRCMEVILSCKTEEQLIVAVKYADLAYKKLSKEIGAINGTNFTLLVERSIGYAQCSIYQKRLEE